MPARPLLLRQPLPGARAPHPTELHLLTRPRRAAPLPRPRARSYVPTPGLGPRRASGPPGGAHFADGYGGYGGYGGGPSAAAEAADTGGGVGGAAPGGRWARARAARESGHSVEADEEDEGEVELPRHPLLRAAALAGREVRAGGAETGGGGGGAGAWASGGGGGYGGYGGPPGLYDKTHPLASPIFASDEQVRPLAAGVRVRVRVWAWMVAAGVLGGAVRPPAIKGVIPEGGVQGERWI